MHETSDRTLTGDLRSCGGRSSKAVRAGIGFSRALENLQNQPQFAMPSEDRKALVLIDADVVQVQRRRHLRRGRQGCRLIAV